MRLAGGDDTHHGTTCATCGQPLGYRTTDKLTGLLDRWAWDQAATTILDQLADQPAVLLMLDLDHFKEINDTHGHLAGDAVLRAVASVVRGAVRQMDIVGRYGGHGGDEFLLLLPATDLGRGEKVAARILTRIRAAAVSAPSARAGRITITGLTASVGLAARGHLHGEDLPGMFEEADAALLRAKDDGRDRMSAKPLTKPLTEPLTEPVTKPAAVVPHEPDDLRSGNRVLLPDHVAALSEQLRTLLRVLPGDHELDVLAALAAGPLPYRDLQESAEGAPDCTLERLERDGLVVCERDAHRIVSCALTPAACELFDRLLPAIEWLGKIGSTGARRG